MTQADRQPFHATRIGRHPGNDIIVADLSVSKRHAELPRSPGGQYSIIDLDSHQGTYVNGARVSQAELVEGDVVSIGPAAFRLSGGELRPYAGEHPGSGACGSSGSGSGCGQEGGNRVSDAARGGSQAMAGSGGLPRLRWTSVPRWPAPVLPPAACYLACCFGTEGERRARALLSGAAPGVPVRVEAFARAWDGPADPGRPGDAPGGTGPRLRALLDACFTGVRVILAGPESVVMRAAAVARQCGAASEELILIATEATPAPGPDGTGPDGAERDGAGYVTGRAGRRVFCAGCRQPFDASAALGDVVTCPGCGGRLTVDHRFSRVHAAYFGWPSGPDPHW
jgi:DNA-directed RNA polymerase subunit RPC12/RpoP